MEQAKQLLNKPYRDMRAAAVRVTHDGSSSTYVFEDKSFIEQHRYCGRSAFRRNGENIGTAPGM